jgi:hypothetical protein
MLSVVHSYNGNPRRKRITTRPCKSAERPLGQSEKRDQVPGPDSALDPPMTAAHKPPGHSGEPGRRKHNGRAQSRWEDCPTVMKSGETSEQAEHRSPEKSPRADADTPTTSSRQAPPRTPGDAEKWIGTSDTYSASPKRTQKRASQQHQIPPRLHGRPGKGPLRATPSRQSSSPPWPAKISGWAADPRAKGPAPKASAPPAGAGGVEGQTRKEVCHRERRLPSTMDGQNASQSGDPSRASGRRSPPSLKSSRRHGQQDQEEKSDESRRSGSLFRRRWVLAHDLASTDEARERRGEPLRSRSGHRGSVTVAAGQEAPLPAQTRRRQH